MSDTDTSGAKATEPAAATAASTTNVENKGEKQPNFEFGTSSGSGLARGKRNSKAAPVAASTAPTTDYTPTVIEVVTPKSEYQNPFAPEEPAAEAAPEAPVEKTKPEPVAPVAAVKETVAPAPKPVVEKPAKVEAPQVDEPKAELNILPPTETKQTAQSWETPSKGSSESAASSDDRPKFRLERHASRDEKGEGRNQRTREPRKPREPRESRGPRETREPRTPREARERNPRNRAAAAKPVKKSGGFFGWLKSLFSGPAKETRPDNDGQPRRRNRGGRGRNRQGGSPDRGQGRGPRDSQNRGGGSREGGGEGGDRPRRSRGGRNRNRSDGGGGSKDGGGGNNPRPEGQQGGGAI